MFEKIILAVTVAFIVAFIGAGCIQDGLVPCHIDEEVLEYVDEDGTCYTPWTSLWDARRIKRKFEYVHDLNQMELQVLLEKDKKLATYLIDGMNNRIVEATEIKDNYFNPNSPIGMMLPLGAGLVAGWLGMSKPSDKKKLNGGV